MAGPRLTSSSHDRLVAEATCCVIGAQVDRRLSFSETKRSSPLRPAGVSRSWVPSSRLRYRRPQVGSVC